MKFRLREPEFVTFLPILAIILLVVVWQSTPDQPVHNARFMAFGTLMDVGIVGVPEALAEQAVEELEKDFQEMHRLWHAWNPGPLGMVNEKIAAGKSFAAPTSVLPLIRIGQQLAEQSDNLFNPAIGKLISAWGFHSDNPQDKKPPSDEVIQELVQQQPKMSDLHIDGYRLTPGNPAVKLDFGAFGKGYGIDRAIQKLRKMGINNAIVNAGGDLRAIGSRAGNPWRIAIRRPSGAGVLGVIKTDTDESIFTSGDYERNYTWRGKRYHHIIDPRTGYPAEGAASVTVIHSDATTADAAATALFVAGPKDWHRIARQMGIKYVLMIDSNGVLHMNPAMQKRLELFQEYKKVDISPPLT
ncbi:MAG: FAD:protein FMN transferase [Chromatiales bacterium]|jgi:thiamine biosynthesis lipoprotein